ncbi:MAG: glycosyltransferase [Pseudonocardiales bacterium]
MTTPSYAVVIPTTLTRPTLNGAVEACLRQTVAADEVIVVAPDELLPAPALPGGVRLLHAPRSSNGQRNAGARAVRSDLVLFVDDDNVLADDFAERLLSAWRAAPPPVAGMAGVIDNDPRHTGARNLAYLLLGLGCTAYRARSSRLRASGHVLSVYDPDPLVPARFLHGCCVAYERTTFLGELFDETFTGHVSGGDLDAAARMGRHGHLFQVPDARSRAMVVPSTMPPDEYTQGLRFGETLAYYRWRHRARGAVGATAWAYANLGQLVLLVARFVRTGRGRPLVGYARGLVRAHRRIWSERRSAALDTVDVSPPSASL